MFQHIYTVITFKDCLMLLQSTQGTQLGEAAIEVHYSLSWWQLLKLISFYFDEGTKSEGS